MRPEILFPLFAPITSLKGVGSRVAPLLERGCIPQVAARPLVIEFHLRNPFLFGSMNSMKPIFGEQPLHFPAQVWIASVGTL